MLSCLLRLLRLLRFSKSLNSSFFLILEAKAAVEVIEASDVILSVEVIEATEVFRTTQSLKTNNVKAGITLF